MPARDRQFNHTPWPPSVAALEAPQYRWLLLGNVLFYLAMQGQILTRTFLAWELTHREMALAAINLAFAIPMLVGSFFGGAVSDRVERRRLVIIAQSVIVANEAAVLLLLMLGKLAFWNLVLAGVVAGAVVPFIMPARTAIVFQVVGANRMGNAVALNSAVFNLSRVLGPALAGVVIDVFSVKAAYVLSTSAYLLGIVCMLQLAPSQSNRTHRKPLFEDIAYGFRYVLGHRQVRICLLFGLVPMFLAMPVQNLMVVFADEVWQVGERGLGWLLATAGMGGVIGSFWVARRGENTDRVKLMTLSGLAFGALLLMFSVTPWFLPALVPLLLANIAASACQTLNSTAVQLLVEDEVRGRVSALVTMSAGLTPLGVLPLAFAAEHVGAPLAVACASVTLVIVVAAFYLLSRELRGMDHSVRRVLGSAGD